MVGQEEGWCEMNQENKHGFSHTEPHKPRRRLRLNSKGNLGPLEDSGPEMI